MQPKNVQRHKRTSSINCKYLKMKSPFFSNSISLGKKPSVNLGVCVVFFWYCVYCGFPGDIFSRVLPRAREQSMIDSTIVTLEWINPFDYLWLMLPTIVSLSLHTLHTHTLSLYLSLYRETIAETHTHSFTQRSVYNLVWIIYIRGYLINSLPLEMKWNEVTRLFMRVCHSWREWVCVCTQLRICLNESNIWHEFF